jgi:predicted metal-dependent HD superfamily phosphohydrolase
MKENWSNFIDKFNEIYQIELNKQFYSDLEHEYKTSRYYHDLNHIEHLLNYMNDFYLCLEDKLILELAIWFHDSIYNSKSKDNEINSVFYLINFLNNVPNFNLLNFKFSVPVFKMILCTRHNNTSTTRLEKIMCDIDLRDGFNEGHYMDNSINIKKEFSHLSDEEWIEGRINFLNDFLKRKRIYQTDEYYNKYEEQAKLNLNKELNYLKNL